jgi:hypothetical protein
MPNPIRYLELRCPGCLWREMCGPDEITAWLCRAGKLRPRSQPELAILYEVLHATAGQLTCPQCGRLGLTVANAVEDSTAWPGEPLCACCSKPIPKERLEAIPGVRHCAACQREAERGRPKEEKDFCPRCGAPLEVRVVGTGRWTRYVLACTANPPCNL